VRDRLIHGQADFDAGRRRDCFWLDVVTSACLEYEIRNSVDRKHAERPAFCRKPLLLNRRTAPGSAFRRKKPAQCDAPAQDFAVLHACARAQLRPGAWPLLLSSSTQRAICLFARHDPLHARAACA
jgi:hypothetical protein